MKREEGARDGCRVSDFVQHFLWHSFVPFSPSVSPPQMEEIYVGGGVIFLRLILSLLVLLEFVGETLSLMLECGFSMLQDNYATPIELLRFAILCM